jgi:CBS-domain-containing membrane protein
MWSAVVGLVVVAQFWTLADEIFNPREGKRLLRIVAAAETLGAMTGGFGANLVVRFLFGTKQLVWLIVIPFAGAFAVALFALRQCTRAAADGEQPSEQVQSPDASGLVGTLRGSAIRLLKSEPKP